MYLSDWKGLSMDERLIVASKKGMERKGAIHVMGNQIVDDGFNLREIERLDLEEVLKIIKDTLYANETDTKRDDGERDVPKKAVKAKK